MRFVAIADLHFGDERRSPGRASLNDRLEEALGSIRPDALVIAGDLTRRGKRHEFAAAVRWIEQLGIPSIAVPGNHDMPYWNLARRFARPLSRFSGPFRWPDSATLDIGGIRFVGANSAASWQPSVRWQDGRFTRGELVRLRARLETVATPVAPDGGERPLLVFVCHHPLVVPSDPGSPRTKTKVGRTARFSERVLDMLRDSGVDLIITGHEHVSSVTPIERGGWKALAVSAPTALSYRLRGEANGFWVVEVTATHVELTLWRSGINARFAPQGSPAHHHAR